MPLRRSSWTLFVRRLLFSFSARESTGFKNLFLKFFCPNSNYFHAKFHFEKKCLLNGPPIAVFDPHLNKWTFNVGAFALRAPLLSKWQGNSYIILGEFP